MPMSLQRRYLEATIHHQSAITAVIFAPRHLQVNYTLNHIPFVDIPTRFSPRPMKNKHRLKFQLRPTI